MNYTSFWVIFFVILQHRLDNIHCMDPRTFSVFNSTAETVSIHRHDSRLAVPVLFTVQHFTLINETFPIFAINVRMLMHVQMCTNNAIFSLNQTFDEKSRSPCRFEWIKLRQRCWRRLYLTAYTFAATKRRHGLEYENLFYILFSVYSHAILGL